MNGINQNKTNDKKKQNERTKKIEEKIRNERTKETINSHFFQRALLLKQRGLRRRRKPKKLL